MSIALITLIAAATFITSIISGVFGMAGGMILMTLLVSVLPVQAAMILHAAIQIVSNGCRCMLWRDYIVWRVLPFYGLGILLALVLISFIHFVPDKAVVLIVMGSVPLMGMLLGRFVKISIMNPAQTFFTALFLTLVQMAAGAIGPLIDLLYNNAPLTRQEIIATKSFTQTVMHLVRLLYFGTLIPLLADNYEWPAQITISGMALFFVTTIAGTILSARILAKMNDHNFKKITRWIIVVISLYCLGQGLMEMS